MTEVKRFEDFHVHFDRESGYQHSLRFTVYPVTDWTGMNGTSGTSYETEENGHPEMLDEFDEARAKSRFSGVIVWRGCWESRIYFVDAEEYWGEELAEMSNLFSNHILPYAKSEIKRTHTGYQITDE